MAGNKKFFASPTPAFVLVAVGIGDGPIRQISVSEARAMDNGAKDAD